MPSNFPNVNNGDIIDQNDVDRYTVPVNNLESGAAWYRDDSGTANAVKVNFATGNTISSYTPGQIVHFKAAATNTGAATLTITGPSGDLAAIPLVKKGGVALAAGDISADQVVAAIYAEDSPGVDGRFEVLGGLSSGGDLTSPVAIADGGTGATTAAAARTSLDVPSTTDLTTSLAGKANTSHTHAASDIATGTLGLARGGTNANLSATGGTGQVLKQSTAGGAVSVGALAASEMPSGIDAAKIGGGAVSNTEFGYLDGVTSSIQTQLNGKAASSHSHAAANITSGQLAVARGGTGADLTTTGGAGQVLKQSTAGGAVSVGALSASDMPSGIDAAKIGGGAVNNTELGYLDGVTSSIQTQLNGKAASSHSHAVDDLSDVSLTLPILGGHLLAWNGIAAFQNYPITDFLSASVMPSGIDAVKIGGGAVSNTEFGYLDGVTSSIQTQLNGRLNRVAASEQAVWASYGVVGCDGVKGTYIGYNYPAVNTPTCELVFGQGPSATNAVFTGSRLQLNSELLVQTTTSPQQTWQYGSGINSTLSVSSTGNVTLAFTGSSISLGGISTFNECVAIGKNGGVGGFGGVSLGHTASVNSGYGLAIGHSAYSNGGIAIGCSATNGIYNHCISLGYGATNTAQNQVVFGSSSKPMNTLYAGKGASNAAPTAWSLRGTSGLGTNIAGGDLYLEAGAGTGSAASGVGRLRASAPDASGTALQTTYSDSLSWSYGKLGFFDATPVTQAAAIANATDLASAISQLNLVLAALRAIGIVAT